MVPGMATNEAKADLADDALMERVIESRDREAFTTLVERHQQAAYSLALHITRKPESAQDAVQEGMLRAWRFAESYREKRNVRGWLLRIVAREGLRLMRTKTRDRTETSRDGAFEPVALEASPTETAASQEEIEALRGGLKKLSPIQHQLLALYYGAGMDQREIGEELSLSQQVVSYRIKDALKRLRSSLTAAGFASAAFVNTEGLRNALCGGSEVPPGILAAVSRGLSASPRTAALGRATARSARRAASRKTPGPAPYAIGLGIAIVGAVGWFLLNEAPARTKAPAKPAAAANTESRQELPFTLDYVYQDDFDSDRLNPFWTPVTKPPEGKRTWLIEDSKLHLVAGGRRLSKEVLPRSEIRSRIVALKGRPVFLFYPKRELVFNKTYELGYRVLDDRGRPLFSTVQRRGAEDDGPTYEVRYNGRLAPKTHKRAWGVTSGILVLHNGDVASVDDEGRHFRFHGHPGGIKSVQVVLWVAGPDPDSGVSWRIDRVAVMRLSRWPSSDTEWQRLVK